MMRMRIQSVAARLVLVLATVCAVVSCGDDPVTPEPSVTLSSGTATSQVLYADQTVGESQIKFTASDAWVASVVSVDTREAYREPVNWLSLSAYAGGAGDQAITLTLTPNTTGKARKAEVHITSAGTTVKVTVEQKAENAGAPAEVGIKGMVKQITYKSWDDDFQDCEGQMTITYDGQGRVQTMVQRIREFDEEDWDEDMDLGKAVELTSVTTVNLSYGNGTAHYTISVEVDGENDDEMDVKGNAKLDAQGRVVSGDYVDDDDDSAVSYSLTYDANGFLQKSQVRDDDGEFSAMFVWENGNPTRIDWRMPGTSTYSDTFVYGTQENCANIDLNWLVAFDSEGAEIMSGDHHHVFAMLGMVGRRARNMVERMRDMSVSDTTYKYECDAAGRPVKITVQGVDDRVTEKEEYTITYTK